MWTRTPKKHGVVALWRMSGVREGAHGSLACTRRANVTGQAFGRSLGGMHARTVHMDPWQRVSRGWMGTREGCRSQTVCGEGARGESGLVGLSLGAAADAHTTGKAQLHTLGRHQAHGKRMSGHGAERMAGGPFTGVSRHGGSQTSSASGGAPLWAAKQIMSSSSMDVEPSTPVKAGWQELDDSGNEEDHGYDYDLIVVGGGSGGISCAKAAADLGAKVALFDYVDPSPHGTKWGLGGTCVNVGCIPKKLMHTSALLRQAVEDAASYGWEVPEHPSFSWETLRQNVADHIGSLNFGYRIQLADHEVEYMNMYARFVDEHTVEGVKYNKKGVEKKRQQFTARRFVIAVGGRPTQGDFPGAEHCITSDDLFSLEQEPGKTLCVGASYVSLECAGFLNGVGYDTTVLIRSIPLRGFDQQMAKLICSAMAEEGVNFIQPGTIKEVNKDDDGRLHVTMWDSARQEEITDVFDTVMLAIGRTATTKALALENLGLETVRGDKLQCVNEQTQVAHVYAVGDVVVNAPELTPVAIQAGKLLAKRLYGKSSKLMNYTNVPTAVFTPVEYGACGMSEEEAISKYGSDRVEVYHQFFKPLEQTLPHRGDNQNYVKLITDLEDDERILGVHILSPNAGEVVQAYGLLLSKSCVKEDLDDLVGIHPTIAEEFTTLRITKRSGESPEKTGC